LFRELGRSFRTSSELLRRRLICFNRLQTYNIYTKSNENINIAKSICPYLKLSYPSVLDVLVTIAHCLRTILVLVGSLRGTSACAANGIVMMRWGISIMRNGILLIRDGIPLVHMLQPHANAHLSGMKGPMWSGADLYWSVQIIRNIALVEGDEIN
jgi:hypothetical protein